MIEFLPLGGADEIGANSYYLNINGNGIILDCGVHPRKIGLASLPKFSLIKDKPVDHILISHAHQDHLGGLPFFVKDFPYVHITTTPQTRAIAELTLHNSVSILKKQIKDDDSFKVYSHDEVDLLIKSIDYKAYEEEFELSAYHHEIESTVRCKFFDAGHILGSASIYLESDEQKILYTGDINFTNQTLISKAALPNLKIDTLILESTYGATDADELNNWSDEVKRLAKEINKVINNGGSILIPVFSLGKTQELLASIWNLMKRGKIAEVDIFTGGIGTKINRVYDYSRYVVNNIDPEFEVSTIPQKDIFSVKDPKEFFKHPSIVLAASGMMINGTASFNLAKHWFRHSQSAIFTVGYMDPDSPGFVISNSSKGDKIKFSEYGKSYEVKCSVKNFRFSAHAKREDLLSIVKKLKPKKVILVHGDPEAIDWLGSQIIKNFKETKVFGAKVGKPIVL